VAYFLGHPVFYTPQTKFLATPPVALGMERLHPPCKRKFEAGDF